MKKDSPSHNSNLEEVICSIRSCLSSLWKNDWVIVFDGLDHLLSRLDPPNGAQFLLALDQLQSDESKSRIRWLFSASFYAATALARLEKDLPDSKTRFRFIELAQNTTDQDLKEMSLVLRHYLGMINMC